jgi:O-antigen/teichoic acid export membrane protein
VNSLSRRALAGVAWNYAGAAVLVLTQIGSTAATARLISPAGFGAYATALAAAGVLSYLTLSAIGNGVLRRSELGPKTVGTALTLSIVVSAVVAAAMWGLADPWASAWHVPAAARLVRIAALTLFFTSSSTIPLALLRRKLRFGVAAITETTTQVIGAAIAVGLAVDLRSPTALAAGQAAAAAALFSASAILARGDLQLGFARSEARELLGFAGQVGALNFGSYVMNTAPVWFTARAFGAPVLGLYSRANVVVGLPLTYLSGGLMKVLYPLYGRVRSDPARTRILIDEGITMGTGFVWPFFAVVAGAAPVIVRVLLGPGWNGTAPLLALFALVACGDLPCGLLTNAGEAFGWMRMIWGRQLTFFVLIAVDIAAVHFLGLGVTALVGGIAVAQWIAYAFTISAFVRRDVLEIRAVALSHGAHAALSLGGFGAAALVARGLGGTPLAVQTVGEVAVGLTLGVVVLLGRSWHPATRVLAHRLDQAKLVTGAGPLARLGFLAPR